MNSTELKAKIAKIDSFSIKVKKFLTNNEKVCWFVGMSMYAIIMSIGWYEFTLLPKEEKSQYAAGMAAFTCFGWGALSIIALILGEIINIFMQFLIKVKRNRIISKLGKAERFEGFINDCRKARK
ncbi:hypothetical protein ENTB43_077 [Enterobacter phage Entb_43]|nr:hypothetical protein vBEclMUFV01_235 [Enterobacter phage vB_EclM-UFV01]UVD32516.1 hypothetical protein ENTB43_077 [Enterobacter phage Entb_43]